MFTERAKDGGSEIAAIGPSRHVVAYSIRMAVDGSSTLAAVEVDAGYITRCVVGLLEVRRLMVVFGMNMFVRGRSCMRPQGTTRGIPIKQSSYLSVLSILIHPRHCLSTELIKASAIKEADEMGSEPFWWRQRWSSSGCHWSLLGVRRCSGREALRLLTANGTPTGADGWRSYRCSQRIWM